MTFRLHLKLYARTQINQPVLTQDTKVNPDFLSVQALFTKDATGLINQSLSKLMLSMVSNVEFLGLGDTYHPGL